jgi:hypothetical protein
MNDEDFIYIPPPDQEPIVDDRQYIEVEDKRKLTDQEKRLIESHIEYAKQVQQEEPDIICSCPMCEQYREQMVKKQGKTE